MMAGSNSTAPQQRRGGVGRMAREMKAELKKSSLADKKRAHQLHDCSIRYRSIYLRLNRHCGCYL